jgi:hypothetical protein
MNSTDILMVPMFMTREPNKAKQYMAKN